MNIIATKTRNWLLVKRISNLLFLSLVGTPQAKFESARCGVLRNDIAIKTMMKYGVFTNKQPFSELERVARFSFPQHITL